MADRDALLEAAGNHSPSYHRCRSLYRRELLQETTMMHEGFEVIRV